MKPIHTTRLLFIALIVISIGCSKQETPPNYKTTPIPSDTTSTSDTLIIDTLITDTIPAELSLMDSLAGSFSGVRYFKREKINCPDGQLPCYTTWTYDTILVALQVVNIDDIELQIIELEAEEKYPWVDRILKLDADLKYQGYPIDGAPEGYYKLHYSEAPYDSLFIKAMGGGGSVTQGGALYFYLQYEVRRE